MTKKRNSQIAATRYRPFGDPAVAAVFKRYPPDIRRRLMSLRQLIFDTARKTEGVGELNETLKWGQPAYLTSASGSGSTIRIDALKGEEGGYALYVHCQTSLVDTFRSIYGDVLTFGGNRSILFDAKNTVPEAPLQHCIRLALTYKLTMTGSRRKSSG